MTEEEWLACGDALPMREFLHGKASDRKLRLFAAACCRLFWDTLAFETIRNTIEIIERYADDRSTDRDLSNARSAAHNTAWSAHYFTRRELHSSDDASRRRYYRERVGEPAEEVLTRLYFVAFMANATSRLQVDEMPMLRSDPLLARAGPDILRDVFGNPFRHNVAEPFWSVWDGGTIPRLARNIYEEHHFGDLPILADALEDAGCTESAILDHLRGPGPHVRGYWALDLVLGKD